MLTREATYEDYGFSEDEDKRLGEFCKNLEMRDKILLLQCAAEVYPNIVDELYCCIVIGMSYDKMNKKKFVALDRKDFYAYRKKTLAVFRAALQTYFLIFATFQYTLLPTQNFAPAAIPICVAVCLPEFNIFCNPAVSILNASEDELEYDVVFLIINTSAFCLISHCLMCFFMVSL